MGLRILSDYRPLLFEDGSPVVRLARVLWYPGCGLICDTNHLYSRVNFDGYCAPLVNANRSGELLNWAPVSKRYYSILDDGLMYERDLGSFLPRPLHTLPLYRLGASGGILPDHSIQAGQNNITVSYNTFSQHFVPYDLHFNGGYSVGPGRQTREVFVNNIALFDEPNVAEGCFWDWISQERVSPVYTLPIHKGTFIYCSDYGVFIQIDYSSGAAALRVLSTELAPTSLSNPILIRGEEKAGHVATYQVGLLDDGAQPVENEVVDWENIGTGTLLDTRSQTDHLGLATTRVMYSFTDVGSATLRATVID
jgi:hypothetical protein